ncbi:MAG: lipase maturation factor family protein [Acidobacteriota bacterium]|nr:lipase maturation factor family protein [Acidobacteriota bacterium]
MAPAARRTTLDVRLPAPELGIWLARLLVVKLMFLSGATKLLSFDATWWDLSALEVHYFTQPLPMATSWWAHQLPAALHKTSVAIMFAIELVAPWLVFCGRRARGAAFVALALLQLAIAATGNYGFFNLLTLVLCVSLLDDRHLRPMFRRPRSRRHDASAARPGLVGKVRLALAAVLLIASLGVFAREIVRTPPSTALSPSQRIWVGRLDRAIVGPTRPLLSVVAPFRSINGYGLFRAMTLERPEIVIEVGSGEEWRALEFRYKPGLLESRPRLVAPHQPRLDWQMWFAALGPRSAGWLGPLSLRLLEGEPSVWALLDEGGVPEPLPEELRLRYFSYEFTTPLDRRRTGQWWKRELIGELSAAMTAAELRRFLRQGIQ